MRRADQSTSTWTDDSPRPADFSCADYAEWYRWSGDPHKILHRRDGPALIFSDGEARWSQDGFPGAPQK